MAAPPAATPTSTAIAAEYAIALAVRGVFTLAVAAGLAALAVAAAGLAALAVSAALAALAAVRAAPPTQRKPTRTGSTTSRCATLRRRTPTQPWS